MVDKINNISSSISAMKNSLKKCDFERCPRYEELLLELNQENNYLMAINATINSECCQSPFIFKEENATGMIDLRGQLYKDNLKAENWFYGDITKKEYLLQRFEWTTKYNLTSCPIEQPYVDLLNNTCFNCLNGHFNLGTRKCFDCKPNEFFDAEEIKCISCPEIDNYYNYTTKEC